MELLCRRLRAASDAARHGPRCNFIPRLRALYKALTISLLHTSSRGDDGDAGLIGGGDDGCGIEEEGLACFDGEAGCACGLHGADSRDTDDGNVEAHVLIGF